MPERFFAGDTDRPGNLGEPGDRGGDSGCRARRADRALDQLDRVGGDVAAVRHCDIVSEDGQGVIGLDLGHRDMNGPLLVRRTSVKGFRVGISAARSVNSQCFEHVSLLGQTLFGFDNHGQAISIRGLTSDNAVPAVRSYGTLCLVEANLTGRDGAARLPAIVNYNRGTVCLRDVATIGYGRALGDVETPDFVAAYRLQGEDKPGSAGPKIADAPVERRRRSLDSRL